MFICSLTHKTTNDQLRINPNTNEWALTTLYIYVQCIYTHGHCFVIQLTRSMNKMASCLTSAVSLRAHRSYLNLVTLSLSNAQWADFWATPWGAGTATLPLRCLVLRLWWHIKIFHEGHKGLRDIHSQWWVRQTNKQTDSTLYEMKGPKARAKTLIKRPKATELWWTPPPQQLLTSLRFCMHVVMLLMPCEKVCDSIYWSLSHSG